MHCSRSTKGTIAEGRSAVWRVWRMLGQLVFVEIFSLVSAMPCAPLSPLSCLPFSPFFSQVTPSLAPCSFPENPSSLLPLPLPGWARPAVEQRGREGSGQKSHWTKRDVQTLQRWTENRLRKPGPRFVLKRHNEWPRSGRGQLVKAGEESGWP